MDYSVTVTILSTSKAAFRALTSEISNWWGKMDSPVSATGQIFKVSWGEPWYEFKVIELKPNSKISWECTDANQIIGDLKGVEKEWVGTKLFWTITESKPGEIQVHLKHEGLVPSFICYDFCSTTWDRFINLNLKEYLESAM